MNEEGESMTATGTQAAEPITSATEPAPCEDETQSVYAWSHTDDDDTLVIQRRSWKLPLAAAILAATGLAAAGITVWPHHSTLRNPAAPPQAAPPAKMVPSPTTSPDPNTRFLIAYKKAGYQEGFPGQTFHILDQARDICAAHQSEETEPQLIEDTYRDFVDQGAEPTDRTRRQAQMLVDTALHTMCPAS